MPPPPPPWVAGALREMLADGLSVSDCAQQITARGHPFTARQAKRLKKKLGITQQWTGDDAALDALVDSFRKDGSFGPDEGYRWVHEQINKRVAPQRVGRDRVCNSIARLMKDWVDERKEIAKKRLIRRVYAAPYYLHVDHIDLNCKLTFSGGVKLYIYGQVSRARASSRHSRIARVAHPLTRAR